MKIIQKITLFCILFCMLFVLASCGEISTYQFYEACLNGDVEKVEKYISQENFTVNLYDNDISRVLSEIQKNSISNDFVYDIEELFIDDPFTVSILGNNISIIKMLYENESIKINDEYAIYVACKLNNIEVVKYLVDRGIFPETYNSYIAVLENDNIEIFEILYSLLINGNEPINGSNDNLLMFAIKNNSKNCFNFLLNTGIFDLNVYNSQYQTALELARDYADNDIIQSLLAANANYFTSSMKEYMMDFTYIKDKMLRYCDGSYSYYEKYEVMQEFNELTSSLNKIKINLNNYSDWEKKQLLNLLNECSDASTKLRYSAY